MAFIQPCFIRKNTPELRNKLKEFGYKPFGSVKYEWDTGFGLSTDNRLGEFESFDNNGLENIIKCESPDNEVSIDCGNNEELFLALAALRDDIDKNQWFVTNKNEFIKCEREYFYQEHLTRVFRDWHKATVEEIIEYFKNR